MLRYNPLLRHCEKKRNLFERKGNFKRHLRIPHSSPFLPIIHFSRAHASLEPLIFSPLILPLCARLNSISIHAKSAPNSLFDCATIIYTYIYAHMYTYNAIYVYVLISHAPPYTWNSFHIPIIYIESSDIRIFDGSQILLCTTLRNIRYSFNAADVHLTLLHRSLLYWNIVS